MTSPCPRCWQGFVCDGMFLYVCVSKVKFTGKRKLTE